MGNIFGYIRDSSRDHNEDRQLIALKELAIPEKNIFIDKQSGKDFKRPQYRKMIRRVRKDDLLYIKSIDRLGRNYAEILEQWRILTKDKGIDRNVSVRYCIAGTVICSRKRKNKYSAKAGRRYCSGKSQRCAVR